MGNSKRNYKIGRGGIRHRSQGMSDEIMKRIRMTGTPAEKGAAGDNKGTVGGTGGPGLDGKEGGIPVPEDYKSQSAPSPSGALDAINDPVAYQYAHIIGSTGAMGATPDALEKFPAPGKTVTNDVMNAASENMKQQIGTLSEEETLAQLKKQESKSESVFASARANMLSIAFVIGLLLHHLRDLVIAGKKNWVEYITKSMPMLKTRTREKYMSIAGFPGILNHAPLGIDDAERLIQLLSPIQHLLDKSDPITCFFKQNGVVLDYQLIERHELRTLVQAVIDKDKLAQKKIETDIKLSQDFSKVAGKLKPEDVAVMLDRKIKEGDNGPIAYMQEIIRRNGVRLSAEGDTSDTSLPKRPIKYINAESIKFKDTLLSLMNGQEDIKKLDRTHLEALRVAINDAISYAFPSK